MRTIAASRWEATCDLIHRHSSCQVKADSACRMRGSRRDSAVDQVRVIDASDLYAEEDAAQHPRCGE